MTLPVNSFGELVAEQQAQMQSVSTQLLDFNVGSVLLALTEANAGNSMWLQAVAEQLTASTRLATSEGNDVDTFIGDFNFFRYLGNAAFGAVTFSRLSTGIVGIIPVGTVVSVSTANNLTFIVTTPPVGSSYPAYNASLNAYVIITSALSCLAPVTCQQLGVIGNVAASAINSIQSSLAGVSTVNNILAYANGQAAWSDAITKIQFVLYIQSLSRAVEAAIAFAVSTTTGVVRYNLVENFTTSSVAQLGFFYVVVDDGTGGASSGLLANVTAAVNAYRGFTIQYSVIGPSTITATIVVAIKVVSNPTETNTQITANVTAALTAYINSLGFGATLAYSKIFEIAYDADVNVANVILSGTTLNTGQVDITASNQQVWLVGGITVNYP